MKYAEFNEKKKAGYAANTKEEFTAWQTEFKHWWAEQTFTNEEQKQNLLAQIKDLTNKKTAWFEKQGNRPNIVRNNYILRESEGIAFARLCNALAEYLEEKTTAKPQYSPAPETNVPSLVHPSTDRQ
jgi:hypothetical protein